MPRGRISFGSELNATPVIEDHIVTCKYYQYFSFPETNAGTLSDFLIINGMYDLGNWVYADSTPMTYLNWDMGQPQTNAENYIGIGKNYGYYWHDIYINEPSAQHFLCEYKI